MEEFNCTICHMVMTDPVRCQEEHLFCRGCIESWLKSCPTCPVDKKKIKNGNKKGVFDARMAKSFIDKLTIKCPTGCSNTNANSNTNNFVNGDDEQALKRPKLSPSVDQSAENCKWTGVVGDVGEHLATCDHVRHPCVHADRGCTHTSTSSAMEQHRLTQCEYTLLSCKLCAVSYMRKDKGQHTLTCTKWPTRCKNSGCEVVVPSDEMKSHNVTCPMMLIACPLRESLGCTVSRCRKDMSSHAENATEHMALIIGKLSAQDSKMKAQESKIAAQDCKIKRFESEIAKQDCKLLAQTSQIEKHLVMISHLQSSHDKHVVALEKQKVELPHWITTNYMWQIDDFTCFRPHVSEAVRFGGFLASFYLSPPALGGSGDSSPHPHLHPPHHGLYLRFHDALAGNVRCDFLLVCPNATTPEQHYTSNCIDSFSGKNNFTVGLPEFIPSAQLQSGGFINNSFRNRLTIRCTVSVEADYYD